MIAMSTPMLPAAPPAVPATAAAAEPAAGVASDDFLSMLGQLLGAPVAKAAARPVTSPATLADDAADAAEDAAAMAGAPIVLPMNLQSPGSVPGKTDSLVDVTASVTAAPRELPVTAAVADQMVEGLLEPAAAENEAAAPTTGNPLQAQPLDVTHLRASANAVDPGSSRPLHHPVGTSAWADELGTRMLLMKEGGQHSASLRLSPEHLGPLEVRISVRDDQASVWFGSAHADTRAAIEQALPRLRELFESQGLALADAGVHHETPRGQPQQASSSNAGLSGDQSEAGTSPVSIAVKLGIVDEYV